MLATGVCFKLYREGRGSVFALFPDLVVSRYDVNVDGLFLKNG